MDLEGIIDEKLAKMVSEANLDQAPERRRIREAFKDVQLGIDHCLFKAKSTSIDLKTTVQKELNGQHPEEQGCKKITKPFKNNRPERSFFYLPPLIPAICHLTCKAQYTGVKTKEWFEVNSRGLEIFSKSWFPEDSPTKALVCFCHGYGDTCTFFFEGIAKKLASSGYGVFGLDYPGFGLSEGLHGYIASFDNLVDDVVEHFSKIKENPEYRGLPSFLFGESMGGAVALKVHFKQPHGWNGAILVVPMCKMADDVVPPWPVLQVLIGLAKFFPKEKLVPQKNLTKMAFKDLKKREQYSYNAICYKDRPRLRTGVELLRTTQEIECRLEEVCLPLMILHGEADTVTDPSVSKALYEKASSSDKKLCLYEDAYHALLEGESDELIFQILDDIISWLDIHCAKRAST